MKDKILLEGDPKPWQIDGIDYQNYKLLLTRTPEQYPHPVKRKWIDQGDPAIEKMK